MQCHGLRPDFTSKLVHGLAFGTPKFYIAPYDKINHELVNLSYKCDVKSDLRVLKQCCISFDTILWAQCWHNVVSALKQCMGSGC